MTTVPMYRFRVWEQSRGEYLESERLATREAINGSNQLELVSDQALEVDRSLVDGNGMTRRLGPYRRWAYGAVDDRGRSYVVVESLTNDPRSPTEAYPLLDGDTLTFAEETASEFNRSGSYQFHGGGPLIGSNVPRLHRGTAATFSGTINGAPLNVLPINAAGGPLFKKADDDGVALNVASGPDINISYHEPRVDTFVSNAGGDDRPRSDASAGTAPTFSTGSAFTADAEIVSKIRSELPTSISAAHTPGQLGSLSLKASLSDWESPPSDWASPQGVAGSRWQSPPDVPEPGPALIEPVWSGDRLALATGLPQNDLPGDSAVNLIAALRAGFGDFVEALTQSGTNLHPTTVRFFQGIPDLLPDVPDQAKIFQMGHAMEHLESLQATVDAELPEDLSLRCRTLVGQLKRCVERFPSWRELVLAARASSLSGAQAEQAVPMARELLATLSTDAARKVVDASVAEALAALADATEAATVAERNLLNFDLVSSIRNVMTALLRPVIYCWKEASEGASGELKKLPRRVGAGAVTWGSGTLIAIAGLYLGAAPLASLAAHLAALDPELNWLNGVEAFLKFISTLPKV